MSCARAASRELTPRQKIAFNKDRQKRAINMSRNWGRRRPGFLLKEKRGERKEKKEKRSLTQIFYQNRKKRKERKKEFKERKKEGRKERKNGKLILNSLNSFNELVRGQKTLLCFSLTHLMA